MVSRRGSHYIAVGVTLLVAALAHVLYAVGQGLWSAVPLARHVSAPGPVLIAELILGLGVLLFGLQSSQRKLSAVPARSESDELLLRERAMLRTLIDNLPDFIYVKDADCRFLVANLAVAEHMGTTPAGLLGKNDFDFFPPHLAKSYWDDERAVMASGKPLINREEAGIDAKGNRITILTTKVPLLDEQGIAVGILGIGRDITARVKVEAEARAARQAAEAASHAKSEFLANMSHEIRTPLNGVLGMAELLLDTKLNREQRDFAATINDSGRALLTVINDILDFSKIEAGKLELEELDIDPRTVLEDVSRLLALQAHDKGLELTVSIDPAVPGCLRGDPHRLRQILLNLGGNAVKFTHTGEVGIEVSCVQSAADRVTLRFAVQDSGIGIDKNRLHLLFQPFSQVDSSTTRRFGGTGLGLSIVRQLVELMQGECGVESEEGRGSRFWFTVPLKRGAAPAVQIEKLRPLALAGRRILAVDDNATNRRILAAQLKAYAIDATLVSSAEEAMSALRAAMRDSRPYEVALLDHDMPDCNGAELGRRINADPELNCTRLVMLTSSGQRGEGTKFAELGFAGYLLKPIAQADLLDTLVAVLGASAEEWHSQSQPIVTYEALQSRRASGTQKRLLLAEDNVVNQRVVRHVLEKLGYHVDVVNDGNEAVKAWSRGRYDAILMDCQMPGLDGYDATREIRQREGGTAHIPIIALTAHALKGADEACYLAGMDYYLTKPIDREQLRKCLEQCLAPIAA
jgi:PAS domain S-box-containing protein